MCNKEEFKKYIDFINNILVDPSFKSNLPDPIYNKIIDKVAKAQLAINNDLCLSSHKQELEYAFEVYFKEYLL